MTSALVQVAQINDSIRVVQLDPVEINDVRMQYFSKGLIITKIDSISRMQNENRNLADLLSENSSIYIKSYGQSGLATVAFRGTSSNHTGLIWNGIRLSTPNLGYLDLSLVDQNFFDNISIMHGGASTMYGSGMIGGSIHLNNTPAFNSGNKFTAGIQAGSFNDYTLTSRLRLSGEKFYSKTNILLHQTDNDFPYSNLKGSTVSMENAGVKNYGIMQDLAMKISEKQDVQAGIWFQYADREIPPTLTMIESNAWQIDQSFRSTLQWNRNSDRNNQHVSIAYFNTYFYYYDPDAEVDSKIYTQSVIGMAEGAYQLVKNGTIFGGLNYQHDEAEAGAYNTVEHENNLGVFTSYRHLFPTLNWQLNLNFRQEFLSNGHTPFLPSLGIEGKIYKGLSAKMSISRNFRAPTMNEKYWVPGGDPDLKPEISWNQELSLIFETNADFSVGMAATVFNTMVTDWILWEPEGAIWVAGNEQKVWARGTETFGALRYEKGHFTSALTISYSYTKSTQEEKLYENDNTYKKQLIYTPHHSLNVKLDFIWKGYGAALIQNYTGPVYTTRDNSESLPGYAVLDLLFNKSFTIKRNEIVIHVRIKNILNTGYEVIQYRPMPGIHFNVGVKFSIHSKKV